MTRLESYAGQAVRAVAVQGAVDIETPVAGHYRGKLRGNGVAGGIRLWFGPPHDPVTGEVMDRSWRWMAEFNGEMVDFEAVWPVCARNPISPEDYRVYCSRAAWARENAPNSAFANPKRKYDPLSSHEPMPF